MNIVAMAAGRTPGGPYSRCKIGKATNAVLVIEADPPAQRHSSPGHLRCLGGLRMELGSAPVARVKASLGCKQQAHRIGQ
jgi:hypothetical protein